MTFESGFCSADIPDARSLIEWLKSELDSEVSELFPEVMPHSNLVEVLQHLLSPLHRVYIVKNSSLDTAFVEWKQFSSNFSSDENTRLTYKHKENKTIVDSPIWNLRDYDVVQQLWSPVKKVWINIVIHIPEKISLQDFIRIIKETEDMLFDKAYNSDSVIPLWFSKAMFEEIWKNLWFIESLIAQYESNARNIVKRLSGLHLQIDSRTTQNQKRTTREIRKNLSKKAFFYFCLSRILRWEDVFTLYNPAQLSQKYKDFIWIVECSPLSPHEGIEDTSIKNRVSQEAIEYIESGPDKFTTNELDDFIGVLHAQILQRSDISRIQREVLLQTLEFPLIRTGETNDQYTKKSIKIIATQIDALGMSHIFSSDIAEQVLSQWRKREVFDDTVDSLMNVSYREQMREWDIYQVVWNNFNPEGITKNLVGQIYNHDIPVQDILPRYQKRKWVKYIFSSVNHAQRVLNDVQYQIAHARSEKEKKEYSDELILIQYSIAMMVGVIVYGEEFYKYSDKKKLKSIPEYWEYEFDTKTHMCMDQWAKMHQVLKGMFGINTSAVWYGMKSENFDHFVTLLPQNIRTDWMSVFNTHQDTTIWNIETLDEPKVLWDVTSTHLWSSYLVYSQWTSHSIDAVFASAAIQQMGWDYEMYGGLWISLLNIWDTEGGITNLKKSVAMTHDYSDLRLSIHVHKALCKELLFKKWETKLTPYFLHSMSYLKHRLQYTDIGSLYSSKQAQIINDILQLVSLYTLFFMNESTNIPWQKQLVRDMLTLLQEKLYGWIPSEIIQNFINNDNNFSPFTIQNQRITREVLYEFM